jgi:hypothetical protein
MALIPTGGTHSKQLRQGSPSQPLASLRQRALGNVGIDRLRQGQIKLRHHLRDRLMPIQRQGDHQPHHLLGRQFALANACFACPGQRLPYSVRINGSRKSRQFRITTNLTRHQNTIRVGN